MKFLDRHDELRRLDALVARGAAGLVALWGRRRVGKSRLLMEWCARHDGLYTVADQSAATVQRRYFAEALSLKLPGFCESEYPDWHALLRRLSREARAIRWRGPLVLDEFPHLVASAPSLPSVLQNWVDQESVTDGLLVTIAGSSQRMMQELLLGPSAPLYGRSSEAFSLQPLAPAWIGQALGLRAAVDMAHAYAVWGGIPRYWELAAPFGHDLCRAVEVLALDPSGPLHREPDRLLLEETPPAVALRPLLDVIGAGAHRLSEIAARLSQPATSLSRPMARLMDLGLVRRETPFGEPEKAGRRTLYRISDPFFRFWFRVVAPHRTALATAARKSRLSFWTARRPALVSETWEDLCRVAVPRLGIPSGGDDVWLPAKRWWHGNEPEWDVVSKTADGSAHLAGEVRWSDRPISDPELKRLCDEQAVRPLPAGLPPSTLRALFVSATATPSSPAFGGVRVYDAAAVMKALELEE